MSRLRILAPLAAAVVLAAVPASAQRGPQEPQAKDAYLARQQERFTAIDANHDGVVIKEELTAMLADRSDEPPAQDRIDGMFARMDTNGDGKATAGEAAAAEVARFETLDADHDGILTPEERRAGMGGWGRR